MTGRSGLRPIPLVVLAALLTLAPATAGSYATTFCFQTALFIVLATSYDLVGGRLGYLNLGHAAFFGLGAYATGLALAQGWSLALAWPLGALAAAGLAALVGYPLFRLHGAYFALATFGLIGLMGLLARNLSEVTGGSAGLSIATGNHLTPACYLALITAVVTLALNHAVGRSRFGLGLACIREDEEVAGATGVPVMRYRWTVLVISAVPAGLAGGLYAWHMAYVSPEGVFGLEMALNPVLMAMLGGSGTTAGPVIGAIFLGLVNELIWTRLPYLQLTVSGLVMILVGLFLPGGLARIQCPGRLAQIWTWLWYRRG